MRAAILQTPGTLDIVDKPAPREVLIRTVGSGLCNAGYEAMRQRTIQGRRVIMFPQ
jgi:hypothetical protein